MENLYLIVLVGVLAVIYSYFLSKQIISSSPGNDKMQEIAEAIQIGAKAYLNRQYKTIAIFLGGRWGSEYIRDSTGKPKRVAEAGPG